MNERISIDPEVHFGKPCVRGTRIPVVAVLELLAEGIGFGEIRTEYYPDLSVEDIRACILFASRRMSLLASEYAVTTGSTDE